jgi:hypothetical protein
MLVHAQNHTIRDGLDYVATWNGAMLQSEVSLLPFGIEF